jgi:hypothetical protein
MANVESGSVASLLLASDSRSAALDQLEALEGRIDRAVALAAAPALAELRALDAAEVDRTQWDRIGLLLGRLCAEASDDPAAVYGAAFGDGRLGAELRSDGNVLAQLLRKPAAELTPDDAWSYACSLAYMGPRDIRGMTKMAAAAGFANTMDFFRLEMSEDPTFTTKMPADGIPTRMLRLLMELLKGGALPDLVICGAWHGMSRLVQGRAALGHVALELDICGLAMAHLRAAGSVGDWVVSHVSPHLNCALSCARVM